MATNHPEAKRNNRKGSPKVVTDKASTAPALNEDDPRIQALARKAVLKMFADAAQTAQAAPQSEDEASWQAIQDRQEHPLKYLKDEDIHAVSSNLNEAAYGLLSIHRLSIDASDSDDDGFYRVAITYLARSAFKTIDACLGRLKGTEYDIGNFATEFDFQ